MLRPWVIPIRCGARRHRCILVLETGQAGNFSSTDLRGYTRIFCGCLISKTRLQCKLAGGPQNHPATRHFTKRTREIYPRNSCKSAEKKWPPYCPVPDSFITSGLSGALSLTVAAPLIDPFTLGVNVTLNVHVAPEATVAPQGVAPDGAAAKSPLATRLDMVRVPPELLVSVTVLGALVVPTA